MKKREVVERKQLPMNKDYGSENVVALLNRYEYHYSIESSLASRSTSQRGLNGSEIADLRMDVENLIFNECVKYVTHIVMKQDGINRLFEMEMEATPNSITKAFHSVFKFMDKADLFKHIKDELIKDESRFKKDEKACEYFNTNVKVLVRWLDFRSTFFSITSHVRNILNKKRHFH